jgi:hypothetical protein
MLWSGGIAAPAVGRDGPNGRGNNEAATAMATAMAATVTVTATATEEEEKCDGCDGADPRRCLDGSLLILANGILLRLIAATTVGAAAAAESSDRDNVNACY